MPYRVTLIAPPGYQHAACFLEVAQLLVTSLRELGHECDITINDLAADRTNILLGFHLLHYSDPLRAFRYIPYQLEQLSDKEGFYSENVRQVLANAVGVWDYSVENIAFLKERGIAARHLPVGFHPGLERIPPGIDKEHDVLFYGSVAGRRKVLLDRLAAVPGMRLKILFGAYGEERDRFIARSRIVLNVHYYSTKIFEAVRMSYLLNNRCFVLSEESVVNPYPGVDLCCVPYDQIVDRCVQSLADLAGCEARRRRTYEQFKRLYPMTELLRPLID